MCSRAFRWSCLVLQFYRTRAEDLACLHSSAPTRIRYPTTPHGLECETSENRRSEVHYDDDFKDGNPGTVCLVQKRGDRATKNGT